MSKKFRLLCTSLLGFLFGSVFFAVAHDEAQGQVKYPEVQIVKFKSGKVQVRTTFVAFGDVAESESFFENGQMKFRYQRDSKSARPTIAMENRLKIQSTKRANWMENPLFIWKIG